MPNSISVLFGFEDGERVRLNLRLPADDEGWIRTEVEVRNSSFYGAFETSFRDDELIAFTSELREVYESLTGEARLHAIEGCLSLDVIAAKHGTMDLKGCATDDPWSGRQLRFAFAIDQSFLPMTLRALDEFAACRRAS